ncbi:MAG: SGNH/GDSL hydrolase family protein [Pseudonocardia sp.]
MARSSTSWFFGLRRACVVQCAGQLGLRQRSVRGLVTDMLGAARAAAVSHLIPIGIPGDKTLVSAGDTQWTGGSDLVLLDATINDVLHRTPVPAFERSLTAIMTRLTSTGAQVIVMMPVATRPPHPGADPTLLARYAEAIITTTTTQYPAVCLARTSDWDPTLDLGPDGIHPNDRGQRLLSDATVSASIQLLVSARLRARTTVTILGSDAQDGRIAQALGSARGPQQPWRN